MFVSCVKVPEPEQASLQPDASEPSLQERQSRQEKDARSLVRLIFSPEQDTQMSSIYSLFLSSGGSCEL